jgi:hypothetical protein
VVTFNVRLSACERPDLLRRAIRSLQEQTYPHWRAIVYDDSSSSAVQEVVAPLSPDRFTYKRNEKRLGAAANIDQCFSPEPSAGADYACVLEDDNYWLPDFLEVVSAAIKIRRWDLIQVNQRIDEHGKGLRPPSETTRGKWFQGGPVDPINLRAALLYMEGLSNGGLVWDLRSQIDLRVGGQVRQTGLHEACRSLLVDRPFLFIGDAKAVWSLLPRSETAQSGESKRTIGRGMQSVRDFVLRAHREKVVELGKKMAVTPELRDQFVGTLAYAGRPFLARELLTLRVRLATEALLKGIAIRAIQPDPCFGFLNSLRPARS